MPRSLFDLSSSKVQLNVKVQSLGSVELSQYEKWSLQMAEWISDEWDYLRSFPGVGARKKFVDDHKDNFYALTYGLQDLVGSSVEKPTPCLIGMFALLPMDEKSQFWGVRRELWCFYIDPLYRDLGLGKVMMQEAKAVCRALGVEMSLETLRPQLNRFYKKLGAEELGDSVLVLEQTGAAPIAKIPAETASSSESTAAPLKFPSASFPCTVFWMPTGVASRVRPTFSEPSCELEKGLRIEID
ncbi:MAG: GNAT family N-acetyltransferase [Gammaproteobacteria bacterium]|nr:GNAT family N-acetyltransferase [Gammaproteobacteria bacterium]